MKDVPAGKPVHALVGVALAAWLAAVFGLLLVQSAAADDGDAFFEGKVRPLLVARCYQCHSGPKTKGGLALDTRSGWQRGGDSGAAIVPGRPDESLLIQAVRYQDADLAMPPQTSGGKLPEADIAVLASSEEPMLILSGGAAGSL